MPGMQAFKECKDQGSLERSLAVHVTGEAQVEQRGQFIKQVTFDFHEGWFIGGDLTNL